MAGLTVVERLKETLKKHKYAVFILMLGLILMWSPFSSEEDSATQPATPAEPQPSVSQQLSEILSQIQGAGKVQVMLSVEKGEETVYQTDEEISGGESATTRITTVIITDGDRAQSGLIQQVIPPKYLGAVVLCQGAENAAVKLAIVNAVSNITGISSDRISVLKMK